ncbi:UPF0462 protein C4orf33 homolog isoform X2 [Ailuropoda melanoleuca]|nr:UPF0462 protein C4orf33 homolog isoform X2 [Ailuropoda melanoleuca]XP_034517506.1 UPF0462 protein C4orf33 homolog isoform X2 [Ailuropoda melanoleuca]XP_034517507.1 UPF0462 protein C4orf33 homolog isoform X2 [Ailuropoda melanoleuca]XP_034517508.1 UPF0462 protein C4orf33 homolog isoform X2 [Ailuropoda melanoleuca]XP_034517509.1 UPF0462 protein C4orf33 homolog isoform X2 [Ailuropoda melanoleuca]XP_034517510.1 UPF0462 protein C4orf33 homolog isoform X2 [Ailuropoda melanoleuca]XP_034517511.1 UP
MDFKIEHTWDGFPVKHEPVFVRLNPSVGGVMMKVSAPFFNDPPAPLGEPGKPFNKLWDYEVVEAFFLNDVTEQYLEVELCPHGQHLVLLLSGRRNVWKQELALSYKVSRGEKKWEGRAYLPWSYFPPNVTRFNSFAIHGSKDKRNYEALYPVPQHELQQGQKPDLHTLQHAFGKNPSKVKPRAWQCSSSPNRGQYHAKATLAPGRGEDNHTHQSDWLQQWVGGRHVV